MRASTRLKVLYAICFVSVTLNITMSVINYKSEHHDEDIVHNKRIFDESRHLASRGIISDASSDLKDKVKLNGSNSFLMSRNNSRIQGGKSKENMTLAFGAMTRLNASRVNNSQCAEYPSSLVGTLAIVPCKDLNDAEKKNPTVTLGGEWSPADCKPLQRVAVLVTYRDRQSHLIQWLNHIHPFLQRQKLHYKIFIIEQAGVEFFNKGKLYNTGFNYANETFPHDCILFHDVDLIPINDRNLYKCQEKPTHLSVAIDVFNFKNFYETLIGGALNMRPEDFVRLNGYSNLYWGWGAEDDDMWYRFQHQNMTFNRPSAEVARYIMLKHNTRRTEKGWASRYNLSRGQFRKDRSKEDGLSSLQTKIQAVHKHALYTHLMVDVGKQPPVDVMATPVD